jgi:hypothetical protein
VPEHRIEESVDVNGYADVFVEIADIKALPLKALA